MSDNYQTMLQTQEFIDSLVIAITGYSPDEIDPNKIDKVVQQCLETYREYIFEYIKITFGQKDYIRVKTHDPDIGADIFAKFPELEEKFAKAHQAFLDELEQIQTETDKINDNN